MRLASGIAVVLGILSAGCVKTSTFHCQSNDQCVLHGEMGVCQPTGFCSFSDETCDSEQRYSEHASSALAGECVGDAGDSGVCDNTDSDGDGIVDEGCDDDDDDFCDAAMEKEPGVVITACPNTPANAEIGDDCDDESADAHPGAVEICDDLVNDCEGARAVGLDWAKAVSSDGYVNTCCVIGDGSGAVYLAGNYFLSATFAANEPNERVLPETTTNEYGFVAKFERTGAVSWVRVITAQGTTLWGLSAAADGGVLLSGRLGNSGAFEDASGFVKVSYGSFVARYSDEGAFVWHRPLVNSGFAVPIALPDGTLRIAGHFYETLTLEGGDPAGNIELDSAYEDTAFVASYDSEGNPQWGKMTTGSGAHAHDLAPAAAGGTVIVGWHEGSYLTFGSGTKGEVVLANAEHQSPYFLAKYSATGEVVWARSLHSQGSEEERLLKLAATPEGTHLLVGSFESNAIFEAGGPAEKILSGGGSFLATFGASGELISVDHLAMDYWANDIAVRSDGAVVVSGGMVGGGMVGGKTADANDVLLVVLGANHAEAWRSRAQVGGANAAVVRGVAFASESSVVAAGEFWKTATFGEHEVAEQVITLTTGSRAAFMTQYTEGYFADVGCDDDRDDYCDAQKEKAPGVEIAVCAETPADLSVGDDCDDAEARINPAGMEMCNGQDDDCNSMVDEIGCL